MIQSPSYARGRIRPLNSIYLAEILKYINTTISVHKYYSQCTMGIYQVHLITQITNKLHNCLYDEKTKKLL